MAASANPLTIILDESEYITRSTKVSTKVAITKKPLASGMCFPLLGPVCKNRKQGGGLCPGLKQLSATTLLPNAYEVVDCKDTVLPYLLKEDNASSAGNCIIDVVYVQPGETLTALKTLCPPWAEFYRKKPHAGVSVCVLRIMTNIQRSQVDLRAYRADLAGGWTEIMGKQVPAPEALRLSALPHSITSTDPTDSTSLLTVLPEKYGDTFYVQLDKITEEVCVMAARDLQAPVCIPCMGSIVDSGVGKSAVDPYTTVSGLTNSASASAPVDSHSVDLVSDDDDELMGVQEGERKREKGVAERKGEEEENEKTNPFKKQRAANESLKDPTLKK
jgi:hypothetical protein